MKNQKMITLYVSIELNLNNVSQTRHLLNGQNYLSLVLLRYGLVNHISLVHSIFKLSMNSSRCFAENICGHRYFPVVFFPLTRPNLEPSKTEDNLIL